MRKLVALAALLLAGMNTAYAASAQVVDATTPAANSVTQIVFNDSGSALTSGQVVQWDRGDTEWNRTGYPYVDVTTTADDADTAGVVLLSVNQTCPDQSLCTIVTRGWAMARTTSSTLTAGNIVSTSTTSGNIGDATASNNACYLGELIAYASAEPGNAGATCTSTALCFVPVNVNITCVP